MVSFIHQDPGPACPAPFNLAAYVLDKARELSAKTALSILRTGRSEDWSFGQIEAAVLALAHAFEEKGLRPGDKILIRLGNSVEFPVAFLAAIAVDCVPVPLSAALTSPEMDAIVRELRPALVLWDPALTCPNDVPTMTLDAVRVATRSGARTRFRMAEPDRMAYIVYTSGSSGRPRAVAHAHRAIWARRLMFDGWYGLTVEDRVLHSGALNWTYTLGTGLLDPWTMGATALIAAPGSALIDLPQLLHEGQATLFASSPGVYRKILKSHAKLELPQLRHGLSAGEKLSPNIAQAWTAASGTPIYEAYGMSECSTFISASPARPARDHSLGSAQPGRSIAVLGKDGPVPYGQDGQIAISREDPGLMLGYYGAPEETASRMRGNWFLTGDRGRMEPDGQIFFLARADDIINAGGFRVSPLEVEHVLSQLPEIESVAVCEVTVKADTTIIAAFYTSATDLDARALARYASERLARFKQPRAYKRLERLPVGPNGKLLRRQLSAYFEAGDDQT